MIKFVDTSVKADLRKKSSIINELQYSKYNIQACMVILFVALVLLTIIISIAVTPNPNAIGAYY